MAKILIVEDYLELQVFFVMLLKMNNYDVRSASSKKEVDAVLNEFSPDLILLDVMLGGDDGREMCKDIKFMDENIAVILLSAHAKLLEDYNECGADDVIEKPFNNDEVLNKIKNLLQLKFQPLQQTKGL